MDEISARTGASLSQIALAWVMARPAIAAPIASATSVEQLTDLMGALRVALNEADIAALDRASA
jgi:aryl-alcohol dehydrogenase-like predicted oxidoreductase